MNYSVCVIDDGVIAPANKNGIDDRGPLTRRCSRSYCKTRQTGMQKSRYIISSKA